MNPGEGVDAEVDVGHEGLAGNAEAGAAGALDVDGVGPGAGVERGQVAEGHAGVLGGDDVVDVGAAAAVDREVGEIVRAEVDRRGTTTRVRQAGEAGRGQCDVAVIARVRRVVDVDVREGRRVGDGQGAFDQDEGVIPADVDGGVGGVALDRNAATRNDFHRYGHSPGPGPNHSRGKRPSDYCRSQS